MNYDEQYSLWTLVVSVTWSSLIFFWSWAPRDCSSSILLRSWLISKSFLGVEEERFYDHSPYDYCNAVCEKKIIYKKSPTSWFSHQTAACHSPDPLWIPGPVSDLPPASSWLSQGPCGASSLAPVNPQAIKSCQLIQVVGKTMIWY